MPQFKKPLEGWGWPANSRKAHYFVDGKALCGKWMFFGNLEEGNDESSDNCTACKKALVKRREKEASNKVFREGKIKY